MQLYDNKVLQIHLLGREGPGFERPFAAAAGNPLQDWVERKKKEAKEAQESAAAKDKGD